MIGKKIVSFIQKETVLCIAGVLAIISAFIVKPGAAYASYIDYSVLILLFCFMLVVAGMKKLGVFKILGEKLCNRVTTVQGLQTTLVFICFFTSMLITNDVALITFVPFSLSLLKDCIRESASKKKIMMNTIVWETLAANLGSACTPIGNPQNLLLYSMGEMSIGTFFQNTLPITIVAAVLFIITLVVFGSHEKLNRKRAEEKNELQCRQGLYCNKNDIFWQNKTFFLYMGLFLICIMKVLHIVSFPMDDLVLLVVVGGIVALIDRSLFREADYSLLFTFVFFFVFIGNIKQIDVFKQWVAGVVEGNEVLVSIILSQVISNVPAAMLLTGFTNQYEALIIGTNLGGMGTLIASMASLISYRFYVKEEEQLKGKYVASFTKWNIVFLVLLFLFIRIYWHGNL